MTLNPLRRKLKPSEVADLARAARVLIAGTENLLPLLEAGSRTELIARVGVGLDGVPLLKCRERGIRVSWTPEAVSPAVAELTIGLMVSITRSVLSLDRKLRSGVWQRPSGRRLGDSVIGIMGLGRIGTSVARLLLPFRPKQLWVFDRKDKAKEIAELTSLGREVRSVGLDELLSSSDIVTVHLPNSGSTRMMLDEDALSRMRTSSFLVNTARGEIVDEEAITTALQSGTLGGAALDVFHDEPYSGPLSALDNVILTPHLGSCGLDCRARMEREAAEEALRFLRNEPLLQEAPEEEYEYQGVE